MVSERQKRERIANLKSMNQLMCASNDERIWEEWIALGVPDCPVEEDYEFIAEENEVYHETVELFKRLISKKGWE